MNKLFLLLSMMFVTGMLQAQDKFFTKTGKINFDATALKSPEKIDALNKSVIVVLDTKTGNVQFSVLMKGFEFERALMQEHFNENYVESAKFPKAEFKGTIRDNANINYAKDGQLTIHGETSEVETDGRLTVNGEKISISSSIPITFADYKISIPQMVSDKVSKTAKINIDCSLDPLKK